MSIPATNILDHIVHLSPPGSVLETAQQFRDLGFTVLPGGKHTSGLTENNLVVLSDGVYLELLSFLYPISHYPPSTPERKKRENDPWAKKPPGWIELGFLGSGSLNNPAKRISNIINQRAKAEGNRGHLYNDDKLGGRATPEGKVLEWVITFPTNEEDTSTLPFYCGDITPRKWRVPSDPPSNTEHPSGALGISYVRALARPDAYTTLSCQLTSVIGHPPSSSNKSSTSWIILTGSGRAAQYILSPPKNQEEETFLGNTTADERQASGIFEVGFRVEKRRKAGTVYTPYGKIVLVPDN